MTREEKIESIRQRCAEANCSKEKAKEHEHVFVFERWDPHPPAEFVAWLRKFNPNDPYMNPAPAWNSQVDRDAYYEWISIGCPEPVQRRFNREESRAKFREAMAKIESRFSRGHEPVITEDAELHEY